MNLKPMKSFLAVLILISGLWCAQAQTGVNLLSINTTTRGFNWTNGFGNLRMYGFTNTYTVGTTEITITNFNVALSDNTVVVTNTGFITNLYAGYFIISYGFTLSGDANRVYEFETYTNGVSTRNHWFQKTAAAAVERGFSEFGVYLPANTGISISASADAAASLSLPTATFTVRRIN
jgi:hypothetical protein